MVAHLRAGSLALTAMELYSEALESYTGTMGLTLVPWNLNIKPKKGCGGSHWNRGAMGNDPKLKKAYAGTIEAQPGAIGNDPKLKNAYAGTIEAQPGVVENHNQVIETYCAERFTLKHWKITIKPCMPMKKPWGIILMPHRLYMELRCRGRVPKEIWPTI
jgi:hypothetical protein